MISDRSTAGRVPVSPSPQVQSVLPALPVSDRDFLREARRIAETGSFASALRQYGTLVSIEHLLAYEHFVQGLIAVNEEQRALIDQQADQMAALGRETSTDRM